MCSAEAAVAVHRELPAAEPRRVRARGRAVGPCRAGQNSQFHQLHQKQTLLMVLVNLLN